MHLDARRGCSLPTSATGFQWSKAVWVLGFWGKVVLWACVLSVSDLMKGGADLFPGSGSAKPKLSYLCALAARTDGHARMNSFAYANQNSFARRPPLPATGGGKSRSHSHSRGRVEQLQRERSWRHTYPALRVLTELLLYRASQVPEHNRNRFLQLFGILVRFSAMARDDITPRLTYPGIYVEEVPSGVRAIPGVSTSVTAFVGTIAGTALNQSTHLPCPRKILRSAGSKSRTFLGLGAIMILAGTFFVGKLLTGGGLKDEQRAHVSKRSKSKPD